MDVPGEVNDLELLLGAHAAAGMLPLVVPGCWDALSAGLIERAGYKAAFLGREAIGRSLLGTDEVALITSRMMVSATSYVREASSLSLIVDAGNGFGNAFNVGRTVTTLEAAGASAVQIEDDIGRPDVGATAGKLTVDMIGKIKAAADASKDLLLFARTAWLENEEPLTAVADRAHAYLEAGAEVVMVGRPIKIRDAERLAELVRGRIPLGIEYDDVLDDVPPALSIVCQTLRLQRQLFESSPAFLPHARKIAPDPAYAAIRGLTG